MKEEQSNGEPVNGDAAPGESAASRQPGESSPERPDAEIPPASTQTPSEALPDYPVAQPDPARGTQPEPAAESTPGPEDPQPYGAAGSEPRVTPAPQPPHPPLGPLPPSGPSSTQQFPALHPAGPGHVPPQMLPQGGPPPTGMPPMPGEAGAPGAPRKGRGKAGLLAASAVVLALAAGTVGGIMGYGLANNGGSHDSSPSQLVSDNATLADVAEAVQPSVVSITTDSAEGSGVVYNTDGYIITNNHVAASASNGSMKVAFSDGTNAQAKVVGTDPAGDLAVIKVDGSKDLTPIKFGDSDGLKVGDTVLAIGSPLGLEGSVSSGIVSALNRTIQAGGGEGGASTTLNGLVQTDAAINPGNSGGALVNGRGELIGINTAIATAGGSEGSVGVGFAIPSTTVESTVKQLIEKGGVEHAFLGVSVTDAVGSGGSAGAIVTDVQKGSPAEKADITRGDVITEIDGKKIESAAAVASTVQSHEPGDKVEIGYTTSDGADKTVSVELGSSTR